MFDRRPSFGWRKIRSCGKHCKRSIRRRTRVVRIRGLCHIYRFESVRLGSRVQFCCRPPTRTIEVVFRKQTGNFVFEREKSFPSRQSRRLVALPARTPANTVPRGTREKCGQSIASAYNDSNFSAATRQYIVHVYAYYCRVIRQMSNDRIRKRRRRGLRWSPG